MSQEGNRGPDNLAEALVELKRVTTEAHTAAVQVLDQLDELNSAFPATRQFLESRGVTRVSQLDSEGRDELMAHLQRTLQTILAEKKAGKPSSGRLVH